MIFSHKTDKDTAAAADSAGEAIAHEAAAWVVRRDRGFSSAREMLAFERWCAADARHAEALAHAEAGWSGLDFIPEALAQEVLASAKPRPRFSLFVGLPLAAAAALALVFWTGREPQGGEATPSPSAAELVLLAEVAPRQHTLSDGSRLSLNQGTELVEAFTEDERRLRLLRGEAHFSVSKDPQRPFIVEAGGVEVRAVGTAFSVNLRSASLEVLVTEGVVELELRQDESTLSAQVTNEQAAARRAASTLTAHQHASVALVPARSDVLKPEPPAVTITTLEPEAVAQAIAWQEPLRRLRGTTLAELALGLAQRTGQRVIFADAEIGQLRLGGRFHADDAEGFVSVVSALLDVEIEHVASGELVVRKKVKEPRSGK